jgi:hypothetical protein
MAMWLRHDSLLELFLAALMVETWSQNMAQEAQSMDI